VLFSHGYAGYRTQSSFLTTALASWGYVVASPQHVSRDLASVLAAPPEGAPSDVDDLRATRDLLTTEAARAGGPLEGAVDTAKVALVGHSAGGFAIRQLVSDPGVVAMVPLASPAGLGQDGQPQQPVPTVPSLYVAGSADVIAALPRVTQAYEQAAGPPKRFAVLDGVTHLGFMDVCTIAQDQGGVLQAATDAGVNVNPVVLRLFADGCDPQYTDATDAWPAIRHLVVAQVRTAMGADATPVGLDASVGTAYPPMAITYTDQLS
jgi:predicted dienelactone hydrolase